MLEHGGNLRQAAMRYGRNDWLDLSTGINPAWYPAPAIAGNAWHRLPEPDPALVLAAQAYYGAPQMLPVAGTQAAIQALPRLRLPSRVVVAAPSYAEHAHHWAQHGHTLRQVPYDALDAAVAECDVMVVVNPNNPTGATVPRERLLEWAAQLSARGGWLIVDEAFGDTALQASAAGGAPGDAADDAANQIPDGLIVLRSVGKFFGLAGLRLGFVAAQPALLDGLADLLGPWTVSGPAQQVALAALRDAAWQQRMRVQLRAGGQRLERLLAAHGIRSSGCALFQWWPEARAESFHEHMARQGIWVRLFTKAARGIRLGLPPDEAGWQRLEQALSLWNKEQR
ncbi:threonine-phosphate decarboxylase [Massilia sp. Root351]|jgi:cobalamin biosynthetic protein CobC|uniref:threonine-phosphate decarboxylase CobD n=1 Tax=Massilia sp. Root351 TaxID=1736522 RepID=UPI00070E0CB8|nr:threonine-phosphate decarboxylase CobD [Massilia sp. Root351]KQV83508.1 threonine-phosphate decarboxylase [Massilia sp. Root351]